MAIRSVKEAVWDIGMQILSLEEDGMDRREVLTILKLAYLARVSDCLEEIIRNGNH